MSLLVIGINHKSASVSIRERVAFAPEQMEEAHADVLREAVLQEAVILSTCNRTEIFAVADTYEDAWRRTLNWLAGYHNIHHHELDECFYAYRDDEALRHMIEVASGLDSMVLGEPQIFGQLKSAFAVASEAAAVGGELGRVFQHVFSVAKKVRTDTAIGENPVSVAYAAVSLTDHIFSDVSKARALLIGAGETIELVARHLVEKGVKQIVVANRTLHRARELADNFGAEAVMLADIPEQLVNTDICIASTASQLPILGKGAVESALKQRKHRPILMVDIAVPRDIEAQVGDLNDVYLYTVDDLKAIVDENKKARQSEARKADEIVADGVKTFHQQRRAQDAVSTVKAYRQKAESIRDAELEKALKQLDKGTPAEEVLSAFARGLTNKLLHSPTSQLRKASAMGRVEVIVWSRELFEIPHPEEDDLPAPEPARAGKPDDNAR